MHALQNMLRIVCFLLHFQIHIKYCCNIFVSLTIKNYSQSYQYGDANENQIFLDEFRSHFCMCRHQIFFLKNKNIFFLKNENYLRLSQFGKNTNEIKEAMEDKTRSSIESKTQKPSRGVVVIHRHASRGRGIHPLP